MDKNKGERKKCIHDGHRKRLIETVSKVGLDGLSKVQALEYILFMIFPRGDVNPLAHRLLDRFNDVATVLEASVEDLMAVEGMGETSAQKLHSLLEIYYYYTNEKFNSEPLKTIGDFYDYIEQLLRYKSEEELYIFGINHAGEIINGRRMAKGNINMVAIEMREIALYVSTTKVPAVFLVHNHSNGSCSPSAQDNISFEKLKGVFNFAGCQLLDSIIIGKDGIYSMARNSVQRVFNEGLEYLQSLLQEDQLKMLQEN